MSTVVSPSPPPPPPGPPHNVSLDRPPGDAASDFPSPVARTLGELIAVGSFLSIIIFMSITGNLLVCVAIYTDRSLRKLSNLFIVSLAIADLFVATLVMVFAVFNDMLGYWMFGPQFCDMWLAFDVMCCTASILNLCSISLDRYLHIRDPMRYTRWMTKRVVVGSIGAIWLVSCLVSFLPISQGLHKPANARQTDPPTCAMDLNPTYALVSSTISFFVPCIVMVALYSRLYMYARKHVREIRATKPHQLIANGGSRDALAHSRDASAPGGTSPGSRGPPLFPQGNCYAPPPPSQHHVSDHKAAVTLGFIMGIFLICWVPFFCMNITAAFCETCISDFCFKMLSWLGYCNSALNPIIYSIFNKDFRRAFRRILTGYGRTAFCCCYGASRDGFGAGGGCGGGLGGASGARCRKQKDGRRYNHTNGKHADSASRDGHSSSCGEKDSTI